MWLSVDRHGGETGLPEGRETLIFLKDRMIQHHRQLLLSVHDVSPRFEAETDRHADRFIAVAGYRFAMLVVPDHWGGAPLAGSPFATRLRGWADAGVNMFVHGWFHRDTARHHGLTRRLRARHMTAGEGEFLGLDEAEAARRMANGRALIEDITGRTVAGFVAPAWLYGDGARAALARSGFALAEDHLRVWQPASGRILMRGPVITWASRSRGRVLSSRASAAVLRRALARSANVRVAVHPGDLHVPALVESIDRTLAHFVRTHRPAGYSDLLEPTA